MDQTYSNINLELNIDTNLAKMKIDDLATYMETTSQQIGRTTGQAFDMLSKQTGSGFTTTGLSGHDGIFSQLRDSSKLFASMLSQMAQRMRAFSTANLSGSAQASFKDQFLGQFKDIMATVQSMNKLASGVISSNGSDILERAQKIKESSKRYAGYGRANQSVVQQFNIDSKAFSSKYGLTQDIYGQLERAVASRVQQRIKAIEHTMPRIRSTEDMAVYASQDPSIRRYITERTTKIPGASQTKLSDQHITNIIQRMMRTKGISGTSDLVSAFGERNMLDDETVVGRLPQAFRNAYRSRGVNKATKTYGNDTGVQEALAAFGNLIKAGNTNAIRLGQRTGLVDVTKGVARMYGKGVDTAQRMDLLGGLVAARMNDTKRSMPFYNIDPNDATQQHRLLMRQNNDYEELYEIMTALSKYKEIAPNIGLTVGKQTAAIDASLGKSKIKSLGNPTQFIIPRTQFDEKGQLIVRDPSWQKDPKKGVGKKGADHWIAIGQSAITRMLGFGENEDDLFANNTYGYGRDSSGKQKIGAPKLIQVSIDDLLQEVKDDKGNRTYQKKNNAKTKAVDALLAGQSRRYGNDDYVYSHQDQNNMYLIRKADKEKIQARAQSKGLPNPFFNFNTQDITQLTYEQQSKQIDAARKKATPGFQYERLGYKGLPVTRAVDFEAMYNALGGDKWQKKDRLDGMTMIDPSAAPFSFQARLGAVNKFMAQRMNWRQYLTGSGLIEQANAKVAQASANGKPSNNYLVDGAGGFYMPMVGRKDSDKMVQALMGQAVVTADDYMSWFGNQMLPSNSKGGSKFALTDKQAEKLRSKYFVNVLDKNFDMLMTESSVKNIDKFATLDAANYRQMFGRGATIGQLSNFAELVNAGQSKGYQVKDTDIVSLTAKQQQEYIKRAMDLAGLWVVRSNNDFSTDKQFMSSAFADVIGMPKEIIAASDANYQKQREELKTNQGKRNYLLSTVQGRQHIANRKEQSWIGSGEAKELIANRLKTLEQKQSGGYINLGRSQEQQLHNRLMEVAPGNVWERIFKTAFGKDVKAKNGYEVLTINDEGKTGSQLNATDIIAPTIEQSELGITRSPFSPGQYLVRLQNKAAKGDKKAQSQLRNIMNKVGLDKDSIYLSQRQAQQLNTGDFDGDTAWIFSDFQNSLFDRMQYVRERMDEAQEKLSPQFERAQAQAKANPRQSASSKAQAYWQAWINAKKAQSGMGAGFWAQIQAMQTMSDDDPKKWTTIAHAVDYYDKMSSEVLKKGQTKTLPQDMLKLLSQGQSFSKLKKQITALSNDEELPQDKMPNIFKVNLPDLKDKASLFGYATARIASQNGLLPNESFVKELTNFIDTQYEVGSNAHEAASWYGDIFSRIIQGKGVLNQKDIRKGTIIAANWNSNLTARQMAGQDVSEQRGMYSDLLRRLSYMRDPRNDSMTQEKADARATVLQSKMNKLKKRSAGNKFRINGNSADIDIIEDYYSDNQDKAIDHIDASYNNMLKQLQGKNLAIQRTEEKLNKTTDSTQKAKLQKRLKGLKHSKDLSQKAFDDVIKPRYEQAHELLDAYKEADDQLQVVITMGSAANRPIDDYTQDIYRNLTKQQRQVRTKMAIRNRMIAEGQGSAELTQREKALTNKSLPAVAKMNWSDVAPWIRSQMEKEAKENNTTMFTLGGQTGSTVRRLGSSNTPSVLEAKQFEPYTINGYDPAYIDQAKAKIQMQEIDPSTREGTNNVIAAGSLRHKAFEAYINAITGIASPQGIPLPPSVSPRDIQGIYKYVVDHSTEAQDLGLSLKVDNGITTATGGQGRMASAVRDGMIASYGTQGQLDGTLALFANQIIQKTIGAGGYVANKQGKNYNYDENTGAYTLATNKMSGRGTNIQFNGVTYTDDNGLVVTKSGTFAPDLMLAEKGGDAFHMYDYKSNRNGAVDSLFQMAVYASDMLDKALEWQAQTDVTKKQALYDEGFVRYFEHNNTGLIRDSNNNVQTKIKDVSGYDTAHGDLYTISLTPQIISAMGHYNKLGQQAKMADAQAGYQAGWAALRQQTFDAITKGMSAQAQRTAQAMFEANKDSFTVKASQNGSFTNDQAQRQYMLDRFTKQQEKFDQIKSAIYKEQNKQDNTIGYSGFNRFDQMLRQLDEMIDDATLSKMSQQYAGTDFGQKLLHYQNERSQKKDQIRKLAQNAAVSDFDNVDSQLAKLLHGQSKNGSYLDAIVAQQQKIKNAASLRESILKNPKNYDANANKWLNDDARKTFQESLARQVKAYDDLANATPQIFQQRNAASKDQIDKLLHTPKGTAAQQAAKEYSDNIKAIDDQIEQRKQQIQKINKQLDKSLVNGAKGKYYDAKEHASQKAALQQQRDYINKQVEDLEKGKSFALLNKLQETYKEPQKQSLKAIETNEANKKVLLQNMAALQNNPEALDKVNPTIDLIDKDNQKIIDGIVQSIQKIQSSTTKDPFESINKGAQETRRKVIQLEDQLTQAMTLAGKSDQQIQQQLAQFSTLNDRIAAQQTMDLAGTALSLQQQGLNAVSPFIQDGAFAGIKDDIRQQQQLLALEKMGGQLNMSQDGGFIVSGVQQGILASSPQAVAAITQLAQQLKEAFRSAMGIHSPSVVMEQSGNFIVEGLVQGIMDELGTTQQAAQSLADGFTKSWDSATAKGQINADNYHKQFVKMYSDLLADNDKTKTRGRIIPLGQDKVGKDDFVMVHQASAETTEFKPYMTGLPFGSYAVMTGQSIEGAGGLFDKRAKIPPITFVANPHDSITQGIKDGNAYVGDGNTGMMKGFKYNQPVLRNIGQEKKLSERQLEAFRNILYDDSGALSTDDVNISYDALVRNGLVKKKSSSGLFGKIFGFIKKKQSDQPIDEDELAGLITGSGLYRQQKANFYGNHQLKNDQQFIQLASKRYDRSNFSGYTTGLKSVQQLKAARNNAYRELDGVEPALHLFDRIKRGGAFLSDIQLSEYGPVVGSDLLKEAGGFYQLANPQTLDTFLSGLKEKGLSQRAIGTITAGLFKDTFNSGDWGYSQIKHYGLDKYGDKSKFAGAMVVDNDSIHKDDQTLSLLSKGMDVTYVDGSQQQNSRGIQTLGGSITYDELLAQQGNVPVFDPRKYMDQQMRQQWNSVASSGMAPSIGDYFSSIDVGQSAQQARQTGEYIAQGIAQGLRGGQSSVNQAAKESVAGVIPAMQEQTGVHSPSVYAIAIGGYICQGLATGLQDGVASVKTAATGVGDAAMMALEEKLKDKNLDQNVRAALQEYKAAMDQFKDSMKNGQKYQNGQYTPQALAAIGEKANAVIVASKNIEPVDSQGKYSQYYVNDLHASTGIFNTSSNAKSIIGAKQLEYANEQLQLNQRAYEESTFENVAKRSQLVNQKRQYDNQIQQAKDEEQEKIKLIDASRDAQFERIEQQRQSLSTQLSQLGYGDTSQDQIKLARRRASQFSALAGIYNGQLTEENLSVLGISGKQKGQSKNDFAKRARKQASQYYDNMDNMSGTDMAIPSNAKKASRMFQQYANRQSQYAAGLTYTPQQERARANINAMAEKGAAIEDATSRIQAYELQKDKITKQIKDLDNDQNIRDAQYESRKKQLQEARKQAQALIDDQKKAGVDTYRRNLFLDGKGSLRARGFMSQQQALGLQARNRDLSNYGGIIAGLDGQTMMLSDGQMMHYVNDANMSNEQKADLLSRMSGRFTGGNDLGEIYQKLLGAEGVDASNVMNILGAALTTGSGETNKLKYLGKQIDSIEGQFGDKQDLFKQLFGTRDENGVYSGGMIGVGYQATQQQLDLQRQISDASTASMISNSQRMRRNAKLGGNSQNGFGKTRMQRAYEMQRDSLGSMRTGLLSNEAGLMKKRDQLERQLKGNISQERRIQVQSNLDNVNSQIQNTKKSLQGLPKAVNPVNVAFQQLAQTGAQMVSQFGRRMFSKAIQQAKNFVKTWDASMTNIQMITMKTDGQISKIGSGLIKTASSLGVSISQVTTAATQLYRQGLSDSEVSARLDSIIKLSKTSGLKAADATKLITVAMNSGMVSSSQQATDVVTALGDSAATNAGQISKGMQKSIASANQIGVSYNDLASLLTIMTSKTQLGGNVGGTMLNTLFGRWANTKKNTITYDKDGNKISANDIYNALSMIGVKMYDQTGNLRNIIDVLQEVGSMWDDLSDANRNAIITSMAGTRQMSNFSAIMEGVSQKDQNGMTLLQKYRQTAAQSEGITDKKYQSYQESLAAGLTNIQTAFDHLIQTLSNAGVITNALGLVQQFINGFASLGEIIGPMVSGISAFVAIGGALVSFAMANPIVAGAVGIGLGVAAVGSLVGNAIQNQKEYNESISDKAQTTRYIENQQSLYNNVKENFDVLESSNKKVSKGQQLTQAEKDALGQSISYLSDTFSDVNDVVSQYGGDVNQLISSTDGLDKAFKAAQKSVNGMKTAIDSQKAFVGFDQAIQDAVSQYSEKSANNRSINKQYEAINFAIKLMDDLNSGDQDRMESARNVINALNTNPFTPGAIQGVDDEETYTLLRSFATSYAYSQPNDYSILFNIADNTYTGKDSLVDLANQFYETSGGLNSIILTKPQDFEAAGYTPNNGAYDQNGVNAKTVFSNKDGSFDYQRFLNFVFANPSNHISKAFFNLNKVNQEIDPWQIFSPAINNALNSQELSFDQNQKKFISSKIKNKFDEYIDGGGDISQLTTAQLLQGILFEDGILLSPQRMFAGMDATPSKTISPSLFGTASSIARSAIESKNAGMSGAQSALQYLNPVFERLSTDQLQVQGINALYNGNQTFRTLFDSVMNQNPEIAKAFAPLTKEVTDDNGNVSYRLMTEAQAQAIGMSQQDLNYYNRAAMNAIYTAAGNVNVGYVDKVDTARFAQRGLEAITAGKSWDTLSDNLTDKNNIQNALKTVLGDRLAQKIQDGKQLTDAQQAYVDSVTKQYQLFGSAIAPTQNKMAEMASQYASYAKANQGNAQVAKEAMLNAGYTQQQINELMSNDSVLSNYVKWMSMTDDQLKQIGVTQGMLEDAVRQIENNKVLSKLSGLYKAQAQSMLNAYFGTGAQADSQTRDQIKRARQLMNANNVLSKMSNGGKVSRSDIDYLTTIGISDQDINAAISSGNWEDVESQVQNQVKDFTGVIDTVISGYLGDVTLGANASNGLLTGLLSGKADQDFIDLLKTVGYRYQNGEAKFDVSQSDAAAQQQIANYLSSAQRSAYSNLYGRFVGGQGLTGLDVNSQQYKLYSGNKQIQRIQSLKNGDILTKDAANKAIAQILLRGMNGISGTQQDNYGYLAQYFGSSSLSDFASAMQSATSVSADLVHSYSKLTNIDENAFRDMFGSYDSQNIQAVMGYMSGGDIDIDVWKTFWQNVVNGLAEASAHTKYDKLVQSIVKGITSSSAIDKVQQWNTGYSGAQKYYTANNLQSKILSGDYTEDELARYSQAIGLDSGLVRKLSSTSNGRQYLSNALSEQGNNSVRAYYDAYFETLPKTQGAFDLRGTLQTAGHLGILEDSSIWTMSDEQIVDALGDMDAGVVSTVVEFVNNVKKDVDQIIGEDLYASAHKSLQTLSSEFTSGASAASANLAMGAFRNGKSSSYQNEAIASYLGVDANFISRMSKKAQGRDLVSNAFSEAFSSTRQSMQDAVKSMIKSMKNVPDEAKKLIDNTNLDSIDQAWVDEKLQGLDESVRNVISLLIGGYQSSIEGFNVQTSLEAAQNATQAANAGQVQRNYIQMQMMTDEQRVNVVRQMVDQDDSLIIRDGNVYRRAEDGNGTYTQTKVMQNADNPDIAQLLHMKWGYGNDQIQQAMGGSMGFLTQARDNQGGYIGQNGMAILRQLTPQQYEAARNAIYYGMTNGAQSQYYNTLGGMLGMSGFMVNGDLYNQQGITQGLLHSDQRSTLQGSPSTSMYSITGFNKDTAQAILADTQAKSFYDMAGQGIDGWEDLINQVAQYGAVTEDVMARVQHSLAQSGFKELYQDQKLATAGLKGFQEGQKVINSGTLGGSYIEQWQSRAQTFDRHRNDHIKSLTKTNRNGSFKEKAASDLASYAGQGVTAQDLQQAGAYQTYGDVIRANMQRELQQIQAQRTAFFDAITQPLDGTMPINVNGQVDVEAVRAAMQAAGITISDEFLAILNSQQFAAYLKAHMNGQTFVAGLTDARKTGGTGVRGSSGGATSKQKGSGKSAAQKLVQQLNAAMDAFDHAQKMLEYAASYYEQNGFLTKQIKALQKQKALIEGYLPKLQQMIQKVRSALNGKKVGSDDWKTLAGQLNKLEEKYAELLNKNAALVKQIRQIRIKIKQLVVDVENSINDAIEADEQAQSSMLDGRVQMEQTILDAIKERYQEEWDLIKKDLQNKKKALQEQMSLIDERLQKRKNAQDQAAKYEELSKLKQQLAMVQADGNRTADAAKIRDQISDLEKQIGWDIAQRQAEAQKAVLQAQLDGYDSYEQTGQQDLQAFLQDANNFTDQINDVMQSGYAGIMSWLETNVRAYRLSMQDEQQKMLEGWRGTYEQMMNISNLHYNPLTGQWQKLRQTDDYNEAMGSKQSYVEYMIKHSQAFAEASLPGNDFTKYKYDGSYADTDEGADLLSQAQQEMIMQWQDAYDAMTKALDGTEDQMSTADRYYANMQSFIDSFWRNFQNIMGGIFGAGSGSGSGSGGGGVTGYKVSGVVASTGKQQTLYFSVDQYGSQSAAYKAANERYNATKKNSLFKKGTLKMTKYDTGGIADYTGPAWLDGSFENPERILSSQQTRSFDNLVDILDTWSPSEFDTMRNMMSAMSYIDTSSMLPKFNLNDLGSGSNSTSIGDVYITLNEAKLEEDADYSAVAQRVGEEFAKQLSRQGVHTNYYMI